VFINSPSASVRGKYETVIENNGWPETCSSSPAPRIRSSSSDDYSGLIGSYWCLNGDGDIKYANSSSTNYNGCDSEDTACPTISACISAVPVTANSFKIILKSDISADVMFQVSKAMLLHSDSTKRSITPSLNAAERTSFITVNQGQLKIKNVSCIIPSSFNATYIHLVDGVLSVVDSCFSSSAQPSSLIEQPVIFQEKGSTTFIASDGQLDIGGAHLNFVPFVKVNSGSFQISGSSKNKNVTVHELNHVNINSKKTLESLFLSALSNSASTSSSSYVTKVSMKFTSFTTCNYEKPETGQLEGGLIGVVGAVNHEVTLALTNVVFKNIQPIGVNTGVVNGGAVFGNFLKRASISNCEFENCKTETGFGGGIYIENVISLLSEGLYF
jgi:hypothetical protein